MSEKKTKVIDGIEYEVVELDGCNGSAAPVELDPPGPAIARWQELTDRPIDIVHDGDAEKVLSFPRPAWADPDRDVTGRSHLSTSYASSTAVVVATHSFGVDHDDWWEPARVQVHATVHGNGVCRIQVTLNEAESGKWTYKTLGLLPSEALELAEVLRAAVDLIGGADG